MQTHLEEHCKAWFFTDPINIIQLYNIEHTFQAPFIDKGSINIIQLYNIEHTFQAPSIDKGILLE